VANNLPLTIAVLGSHSALQILKGAKDEGFKTICICVPARKKFYEMFNLADEILTLDSFANFEKIEDELIQKKAILIPHGSLIEYLGIEKIERLRIPHYGTRKILKWEADRQKQREWLEKAGLNLPKIFHKPEDINQSVIIKFHGAAGGRGYFLANSPKDFYKKIKKHPNEKDYVIQEYIVGVPVYAHYFYSQVKKELEIMGFDKRYESNADSIGRVAANDQITADIQTSYTIIGNIPMTVRESLLPKLLEMGQQVVNVSQKLEPPGLFGPFCLEMIIDHNLKITVFEISARIVAGTNPFINGSPYTWLKYNEPMSTGRRIARDIKEALQKNCVEKILG